MPFNFLCVKKNYSEEIVKTLIYLKRYLLKKKPGTNRVTFLKHLCIPNKEQGTRSRISVPDFLFIDQICSSNIRNNVLVPAHRQITSTLFHHYMFYNILYVKEIIMLMEYSNSSIIKKKHVSKHRWCFSK